MGRLNNRQQRFVEEYMVDLNATQAAIRAGYSVKTAAQQGSDNLKKPDISRAIKKLMAERSRRTGISAERVLLELARIGFAKAPDIIDDEDGRLRSDINDDDAACVQSIRVRSLPEGGIEREVKLYDKQRPLELLYRHTGGAPEKIDITSNGKTVQQSGVLLAPGLVSKEEWQAQFGSDQE